jgi:hypothetical protein
MPYKHNEPRRHQIPKAKYKVESLFVAVMR